MPERAEPEELDINDTALIEGAALEYDLKEDFQARSAPPPGRSDPKKPQLYKFRLFLDDEKVERTLKQGYSPTDPNGYFYKKTVSCKLQDESGKWQDSIVFANFSSAVPKGKKTSSMLGMLQYLRVKVQGQMSELAVTKLFFKALKQLDGPAQIAECDWSAWDSSDNKRNELGSVAIIAETGKAANTMLNFPKKVDGTYQHIVHTKQGLELVAKLKIIKWMPPVVKPAANGAVAGAVQLVQQKPVVSQPKPVVVTPAPIIEEVLGAIEMGDDGEVILDV